MSFLSFNVLPCRKNNLKFNQSLSHWNVSNKADTNKMFYGCSNYNQPLEIWEKASRHYDTGHIVKYVTHVIQHLFSRDVPVH